ncbi:MAG: hypothetical protein AB7Y46_09840 [Armatimonadota bacterium]
MQKQHPPGEHSQLKWDRFGPQPVRRRKDIDDGMWSAGGAGLKRDKQRGKAPAVEASLGEVKRAHFAALTSKQPIELRRREYVPASDVLSSPHTRAAGGCVGVIAAIAATIAALALQPP